MIYEYKIFKVKNKKNEESLANNLKFDIVKILIWNYLRFMIRKLTWVKKYLLIRE